jgi:hypothetical protein
MRANLHHLTERYRDLHGSPAPVSDHHSLLTVANKPS